MSGLSLLLDETREAVMSILSDMTKERQKDETQRYGVRWDHKAVHGDKDPLSVLAQSEPMDVDRLSAKFAEVVRLFGQQDAMAVEVSHQSERLTSKGELVCLDIDALFGTMIFRNVLRRINSFSVKPSEFQWIFIYNTMHSTLPFLFSGLSPTTLPVPGQACDWTRYKHQICAHLGFKGLPPDVGCAASTPRQFGKTTAQTLLMAALLIEVPGLIMISVSTGSRISTMVSRQVRRLISQAGNEANERIVSHNTEITSMRPRGVDRSILDSPMNSILYSLPSNPERLRGMSGTFVFLDESAFVDSRLLTEFVLPLLTVNYRKLFAISTPSTERRSFFGQIIANGKDVGFETIVIEAMCKDCAAKSAKECPHRSSVATPWTSVENQGRLRAIYEFVSRDSYNREVGGATIDTTVPGFKPEAVNRVFDDPTRRFRLQDNRNWTPRCVFMGIDPSGLGANSDFAIISFFYTEKGEMVVSVFLCVNVCCQGENSSTTSWNDAPIGISNKENGLDCSDSSFGGSGVDLCTYAMIIAKRKSTNVGYLMGDLAQVSTPTSDQPVSHTVI